ncbi:MAG: hypothetical protein AMJ54_16015 [Deltaproteobacteria bacterium SG8_13]|nr:MAG: hypothetical protein AMJ54_16015 [Deltaproteobacteria bacterium SG8_13]
MYRSWNIIISVLVLTVLILIGLFAGRFTVYLTSRVMILSIFALGYNILFGLTGLLSFGHAAFYAAGAYGLGLFSLHVSPHPLIGILVGVACACVLAAVIGFFCVRQTEIYFAMLTLAFGMMIFSLIWNMRGVTGGDDGLVGIMRAPISLGVVSIPIIKPKIYYFLVLFFLALSVFLIFRIRRSPFGLVLAGIRENDRRGEFAGISLKNYCRLGRCPGHLAGKQYDSVFGPLEPLRRTGAGQPDRRHPDIRRPACRQCRVYRIARNYRTLHPQLDALVRPDIAGHYHGVPGRNCRGPVRIQKIAGKVRCRPVIKRYGFNLITN